MAFPAIAGSLIGSAMSGDQKSGGSLQDLGMQGLSQLQSGLIGQLFQGMSAKRNWKYSKKAMNYQNQLAEQAAVNAFDRETGFYKEMREADNQYNSASAQLARLRDAGLNGAAVLSGGGISGASQASASPSTGGSQAASVPGIPGMQSTPSFAPADPLAAAHADLLRAQADKVRSETTDTGTIQKLRNSEIEKNLAAAGDHEAAAALKNFDLIYKQTVASDNIDSVHEGLENLRKQGRLMDQALDKSRAETANIEAATINSYLDMATTFIKWKAMKAGIRLTEAQTLEARTSAYSKALENIRELRTMPTSAEGRVKAYRESLSSSSGVFGSIFSNILSLAGYVGGDRVSPLDEDRLREEFHSFLKGF